MLGMRLLAANGKVHYCGDDTGRRRLSDDAHAQPSEFSPFSLFFKS